MIQDQDKRFKSKEEINANLNYPEYVKLKHELIMNYGVSDRGIEALGDNFSFEMNFHNITATEVLDTIEANKFNMGTNAAISEEIIILWLKESLNNVVKTKPNRKKKGLNINSSSVNNNSNNLSGTKNERKASTGFTVESTVVFNEKNHNTSHPQSLNSNNISYSFFSNYEIKEYTLIPKDEYVFNEEYKQYYKEMRQSFIESFQITEDDALLDVEKFILVVAFDSTHGKHVLNEITLVDPLKDYKKYLLKIENENCLKEFYFFTGQIIYLEGYLKSNEIYASKISFGLPMVIYDISESYVREYFTESSPYITYVINGPIFGKNDVDLSVFIQTLKQIANENPHALLLSGPLISVDNSIVMSGGLPAKDGEETSMNFFEFFETILYKINEIFLTKRTVVILSPSLMDATCYYPLPMPSYNLSSIKNINNLELAKSGRLKLIGNPQIFQLNEIIVGVGNFDTVKDMITNSLRSQNKPPLDYSLEMILMQRSFYPLLPDNVSNEDDKTIIVDYRKLKHFYMNALPDIFITSSAMNTFAKKINSTLFINPGQLMKGNNLGSYAKITSYPPNSYVGYDVVGRLKVEICKLVSKER